VEVLVYLFQRSRAIFRALFNFCSLQWLRDCSFLWEEWNFIDPITIHVSDSLTFRWCLLGLLGTVAQILLLSQRRFLSFCYWAYQDCQRNSGFLRTVPYNTKEFLCSLWPCKKNRSYQRLLEPKKNIGGNQHFSEIIELQSGKNVAITTMF